MSKNAEVEAWFAALDHPLKAEMLRVRDINPRSKAHVSLLFHTGAQIPGKPPRLEGGGDTARSMRFTDLKDVDTQKGALESVVREWCAWKDQAR
ncbi:MAG: DUF1801 domain-containing protein [SAR202 cluster bacterium]|nr:DUF1801 domain-containing protein [SAR202 cluster bacterium]